ncbi:MAG: hypothetical protein GTO30_15365 [Acidobacteria bacterium]|nr:hypothetical protein [Acidobacteriota bacterium]NIM62967.1 hypothetical protein [Acidobacteriota bacterium]NIO57892.1 hypothetical protein [Acidobacteriota bacterium]NIQ86111.1 hypothetical protein [Acidobacteriota bacterium]NIT11616.1 hypothetical protein [Acidobacteriota bacterium]
MPSNSSVCQRLFLVVALGAVCVGCTIDDPQVSQVGSVSLLTVDPAIVAQSVVLTPGGVSSGNRVQTMLWTVTQAMLTIDGDPRSPHDLLFPEAGLAECQGIDTANRITTHFGTCVENLVLEAVAPGSVVQATLVLDFKVRVKRVRPVVFPYIGDDDGDGVLNGNDNCILVPNGDCGIDPLNCDADGDGTTTPEELSTGNQRDSGGFGIGNACRVVNFFTGVEVDSDGDGVPDVDDNCVHRPNPDQANPPTPGEFSMVESRISDTIGLACESDEQVYEVELTDVTIPFDFDLPTAQGFVLVDFNNEQVLTNCDWDMGTCTFDETAVQACIRTSVFDAVVGCV